MAIQYSFARILAAWAVHTFTASGLVSGFLSLLAVNQKDWQAAAVWMGVSLIIDGIDGTFARIVGVKEVLPEMDGKTIDFVVDFFTYAVVPAYFFYYSGLAPAGWALVGAIFILLISGLYYGRDGMVSDQMQFIGFPVLWNLVIFVLFYILSFPTWANILLVFVFGVLHFVPLRFAYPSRAYRYRVPHLIATVLMIIAGAVQMYLYPVKHILPTWTIILGSVYFMGMACWEMVMNKNKI